MEEFLKEFAGDPSVGKLSNLRKSDLLEICQLLSLKANAKQRKQEILQVVVEHFVNEGKLLKAALSEIQKKDDGDACSIRKMELDAELQMKRMELDAQIRLKELEIQHAARAKSEEFDYVKHIRLVPHFSETECEKFFEHFEKTAKQCEWPKKYWSLFVQSVLVGKAQAAYASLDEQDSNNYAKVKQAVLNAYELIPEAYRQKFRSLEKVGGTFVEFAHDKRRLFERWCSSRKVVDLDDLKELVLVEEFKRCVPPSICTYLDEHGVVTLHEAAVLADQYTLIHKDLNPLTVKSSFSEKKDSRSCFYCKQPGHLIGDCPKLEKKKSFEQSVSCTNADHTGGFAPFIVEGKVNGKSLRILRDTGASQTLLLKEATSGSAGSFTGVNITIKGVVGKGCKIPLHRVDLDCELAKGAVLVGVVQELPVEGISMLLGNDLAGSKVVTEPKMVTQPDDDADTEKLTAFYPGIFPACAVTRSAKQKECDPYQLENSFMANLDVLDTSDSISLSSLVTKQKADGTLSSSFDEAVTEEESADVPVCFYLNPDGVLMRKWRASDASAHSWNEIHQVVTPTQYREEILRLAHESPMGGHLGVRKTLDRVRHHFYWPNVLKDVLNFCRVCHTCQVVGKPNAKIPVAPLKPIPAVGEPFSRVIIDCVGPLPRSKSGNEYLLTIMDSVTRFPEAIPMRNITAKSVIKALIKFFTTFGLPRVVQSDQGSNFTSNLFRQVLKELGIKHQISAAYHPESQGALERFHQTLKNMIRTYCFQNDKQWDEGVPLLLFAAREVVQESLGFSPFELIFGHVVRGPLNVLKEKMLDKSVDSHTDVLSFVSSFRERLFQTREVARKGLECSQKKMKTWYDAKARFRHFRENDQVLVLLPIQGSLQARYCGPYSILKRLNEVDYIVSTPDRKKSTQLCHINMLKPYLQKKTEVSNVVGLVTEDPLEESNLMDYSVRLSNSEVLSKIPTMLNHLTESQRKEVCDLIERNAVLFPDVPSKTSFFFHDVDVGDNRPLKQHPYRVNPFKKAQMVKEVDFMLANGIIQHSASPWSSPCLLVLKRDDTFRFCTDYRKVNAVTKTDSFPIPRIDDCIDQIGSAKFVSKFDLMKGYWQVPLTPRAREVSAFVTPNGLYEYLVMPFGMKNAPATFQRMMTEVVKGLDGCGVYIDDIIIYTSDWENHITVMEQLFERLSTAELTVNLKKCDFAKATVTYLGHEVGGGMVRPIEAKVEAISNFPIPNTKKELMRFLGMAGFYRKFCQNFASVISPLTELLRNNAKYEWSDLCNSAFCRVKSMLSNSPVLCTPDFSQGFTLTVDASDVGAGAVLQQMVNGVLHPVAYYSKKFTRCQRSYSTVEKEALSLVLALEHFEVYVSASPQSITVYTDHNPLVFINRMKGKNQRVLRWSLILQEFCLEIHHIRGSENVVADALSR